MTNVIYNVVLAMTLLVPKIRSTTVNMTTELPEVTTQFIPFDVWRKEDYPNPRKDINKCGRGAISYVCDPNNILPSDTADELDELISGILKDSMCPCTNCPLHTQGYSLAVAVVPALVLRKSVPRNVKQRQLELQRFAAYLRRESWKFGFCGNDGVIAMAANDGLAYTSVGPIIREKLTRQCLKDAESMTQETLGAGNHTDGLVRLLKQFRKYITDGSSCIVDASMLRHENWPIEAIIGMVFGCFSFFVVCIVTMTRFCVGTGMGSSGGGRSRFYKDYMRQKARESARLKESSSQVNDSTPLDQVKNRLEQEQELAIMLASTLEKDRVSKAILESTTKARMSDGSLPPAFSV